MRKAAANSFRGISGHPDAELISVEALVDELRAHPDRFPDAASLAVRMGISSHRVPRILLQHYHATADELLERARLASAKQLLLAGEDAPARIARAAGYPSSASFREAFQANTGLTPAA
ncbi:MAG: helix-turn-helix domain-containing protein, partial [Opitutaceae bacterium]